MNLISKAADYAAQIHAGQVRKYTGERYFNHLAEVASWVKLVTFDEDLTAAAYLHDSIEDQGETRDSLARRFNERVARLVWEVSDRSTPSDGNRETRKAIDRQHLAEASSEGKTIKLADLISNTTSIVERDPNFAKVYMREKRLLMPILIGGHPELYRRALDLLEAYENTKMGEGEGMTRFLVAVRDVPARGDSGGCIELSWRSSRPCLIDIETLTGRHRHAGIEDFTETEVHEYRDNEEREQLLRIYTPR